MIFPAVLTCSAPLKIKNYNWPQLAHWQLTASWKKNHGFPFWGPRDPGAPHSGCFFWGLRPYWEKTWDAFSTVYYLSVGNLYAINKTYIIYTVYYISI